MKIFKKLLRYLQEKKLKELQAAARLIQDFYINKYNLRELKDQYNKAREDILTLGITQINVKKDKIIITLRRPGMLIGRHGINIDNLAEFVRKNSKYNHIHIEEDKVMDYLIPYYCEEFTGEDIK
jgi:ribosomal protein S3